MAYINSRGALIILRIEWVLFFISLILYLVVLIGGGIMSSAMIGAFALEACEACDESNENEWENLLDREVGKGLFFLGLISMGVFGLLSLVLHCCLNYLLRNGIQEENSRKCLNWILIHLVFLVLSVLFSVSSIVRGGKGAVGVLVPILSWIYRLVSIFIIKKYVDEINNREAYLPTGGTSTVTSNETGMTEIPL